ncbi:MAG TPA: sigma-70 family RNA polymerase sigma factor [Phycisphaerae bacterium]|jgi:RNA polymerase sigma-70 factor (ECF subfamily)
MEQATGAEAKAGVQEWVLAAKAGDAGAFRRLVENFYPAVEALLLRLTHDAGLSEELAHDAFVKAYLSLAQVTDGAAFGGWLSRIAARLYVDHLRSARRFAWLKERWSAAHSLAVPERGRTSGPADDPAAALVASETAAQAWQLLERLSMPLRVAWSLRELAGLSERQIAEVLGCPVGTVESRLHRARARLAELGRSDDAQ